MGESQRLAVELQVGVLAKHLQAAVFLGRASKGSEQDEE
jgi:hypothetical protein